MNLKSISVLFFIVLFGFVLRVWDLGEASMWIDEIYTVNGAEAIVENGYPILDSGSLYTNTPVSTYVSAVIMKFVAVDPMNPWPLRLPGVVFGTLSIIAIFILAKNLFKRESVALISAFLMSFSYWEIAWSRQIRGYEICAFFLISLCIFTYTYLKEKKRQDIIFAAACLFLALFSHWIALAFVIPFVVCIFISHRPEISFDRLKLISTFSFIFLLVSIGIAHSIHPFGLNMSLMFSEILPWVIFVLGGFFLSLTRVEHRSVSIVLASVAMFSFSIMILYTDITYSRYLFPFMPFFFIYTAYVIGILPTVLFPQRVGYSRFLSFTLLIAISFLVCTFIPRSFYALEHDSPQPDFKSAFSIIKENIKPGDSVISVYPVVQKVFLGDKGLWLSLPVGTRNNMRLKSGYSTDFYVNAPSIGKLDGFAEIMKKTDGFIVVDPATKNLISKKKEYLNLLNKAHLIYESGESQEDRLWVYGF